MIVGGVLYSEYDSVVRLVEGYAPNSAGVYSREKQQGEKAEDQKVNIQKQI